MKLRTRLFVAGIVVAVPLSLGLLYLNAQLRQRDMRESLQRNIEMQFSAAALDRCEADPDRFAMSLRDGERGGPPPDRPGQPPDRPGPPPGRGGRGGGPPGGARPSESFVYRGDFTSIDRRAPELPQAFKNALMTADSATETYSTPEGDGVAMAIRVQPADRACSVAYARLRPRPGTRRDEYTSLALVLVSVLGAVWIAAGPVISRMRRLAAGVEKAAASRYEVSVPDGGADEVSDLARAFNAAGADVRQHIIDLQAQRDALRKFVANTTHDIAMPLTVLQGHLAQLDRTLADRPEDAARVRVSIEEAHYLSSLLRNLGVAAKLDAGEADLDRRPVDVNALVERAVSRHRSLANAKSIELNYAVPERAVTVTADITLLEQAVSNLVDNAIQYNHAGGHVAVVLDEHPSGRFAVTIVDDGPGVPENELALLTTRRFRGSEARSRRPDGQGLGLGIVAEAVERLGFTLAFRKPPEGPGMIAEISGRKLGRE